MGRLYLVFLENADVYSCKHCKTHLALGRDIVSKLFQSKHGKAYLFRKVIRPAIADRCCVNLCVGQKEERLMTTGMHTVADVFCVGCGSILGWKYETAHVKTQKYKEGMFILERFKVLGPDGSNYCESDDTQDDEGDAADAADSLNLP